MVGGLLKFTRILPASISMVSATSVPCNQGVRKLDALFVLSSGTLSYPSEQSRGRAHAETDDQSISGYGPAAGRRPHRKCPYMPRSRENRRSHGSPSANARVFTANAQVLSVRSALLIPYITVVCQTSTAPHPCMTSSKRSTRGRVASGLDPAVSQMDVR